MLSSVIDWLMFVARRSSGKWTAGALLLLISGTLLANDHTYVLSEKRSASILFYSYPVIASSAYAPQGRLHRYVVKDRFQSGMSAYVLLDDHHITRGKPRFRHGHTPGNPYLSTLDGVQAGQVQSSPSDFSLSSDPQRVLSITTDDEWSFRANPLLNLNHAHERGATFSIRHDF